MQYIVPLFFIFFHFFFEAEIFTFAKKQKTMEYTGNIYKMRTEHTEPITYYLMHSEGELKLNDLLGKQLSLQFKGIINCVSCGKKTKTSFGQGYCYPCFMNSPENEPCVLRPELCQAHLGIARDMEYAQTHCLQEHIVYLAVSSEIKVGVTRKTQMPTRWIDQGASFSAVLARTPNRYTAGLIEVALKAHFTDKTNWQKMLKNEIGANNLAEMLKIAKEKLPAELQIYCTNEPQEFEFKYPVQQFPKKVKSLSFDKETVVQGILTGIKGQYLYFDYENVINIRKHNGYLVQISF